MINIIIYSLKLILYKHFFLFYYYLTKHFTYIELGLINFNWI